MASLSMLRLSMLYLIIIISLSTGHFLTTLSKKLIDEVLGTINFSQQPSQAAGLFPQFENCNINQCCNLGKTRYFIFSENPLTDIDKVKL